MALLPPSGAAVHAPDRDRAVLLVMDIQVDFLPGGALAVPGGDEIVGLANHVATHFTHVVLTQDWHPAGHVSFASSHAGKAPHDRISLPYGEQILWPDHCVQDSAGARLASRLEIPHVRLILRKGIDPTIDSYSAFYEADRTTPTGLAGYLRELGVDTVYIAGLATDFCVCWSAVDAASHGFTIYVIEDVCRGLNIDGSLERAWAQMAEAGVHRIHMAEVTG